MPKKLTLEEMKKIAIERDGKCLSKKYTGATTKLKWRCNKKHTWFATPHMIKQGTWCPDCANELKITRFTKNRLTIVEMQEIAKIRGGKCLSDTYLNNRQLLKWKCANGHTFELSANKVKDRHQWCPTCTGYKGEEKSRFILSKLLSTTFKKDKKTLGYGLELDGYNKDLNLAFEFQGRQHYFFNKRYHKTIEVFEKQQERDKQKQEICKHLNIRLIIIPYTMEEKDEILINFIKAQLDSFQLSYKHSQIQIDEFYKDSSMLKKLQELAKTKGGKCLSKIYPGTNKNMKWKCSEEHTWETKASYILGGSWCPKCSGSEKLNLEEMQHIAKDRGGKCLSLEYKNNKTNLKWECFEKHTWEASPTSIKSGKWCPHCAGNVRSTIEEMHSIAKERGGKCLSKKYINAHKPLKWECSKGHQWEANANSIKNGRWCNKCAIKRNADKQRGSIQEMRIVAKEREGKCLSTEYIDAKTYLEWECAEGHTWEATGDSVKRGSWCPRCAGRTSNIYKK